jgi:hypothetical protein
MRFLRPTARLVYQNRCLMSQTNVSRVRFAIKINQSPAYFGRRFLI